MPKHVTPFRDQFVAKTGQRLYPRKANVFESAFLLDHVPNDGGDSMKLAVSEQIDYVIEVTGLDRSTRARTFSPNTSSKA
jgi:hypothetical protein